MGIIQELIPRAQKRDEGLGLGSVTSLKRGQSTGIQPFCYKTMQAQNGEFDNSLLSSRGDEMLGKLAVSLDDFRVTQKTPLRDKRRASRKVSFTSESPVSITIDDELTDKEQKDTWWQRNDLQSIRRKARSLALRIQAGRQKNDFEYSYACTMETVYRQARDLSDEEELKLWAWFSQAHARRGLERLSANQVGRNRKAKAAIRKILGAQRDISKLKMDQGAKAKMLALISEEETGQARALAEVFGKADMVAATLCQLET